MKSFLIFVFLSVGFFFGLFYSIDFSNYLLERYDSELVSYTAFIPFIILITFGIFWINNLSKKRDKVEQRDNLSVKNNSGKKIILVILVVPSLIIIYKLFTISAYIDLIFTIPIFVYAIRDTIKSNKIAIIAWAYICFQGFMVFNFGIGIWDML